MKAIWILFAAALVIGGGACTRDDEPTHADAGGHSSLYPTCDEIIKRCHPLDVGEGPIHDCHDLGHGAESDEVCVKQKDACFRVCVPDAGASDAGADAPLGDAAPEAATPDAHAHDR
jgi:hypothetical protein